MCFSISVLVLIGPVSLIGMVLGFLLSGIIISKFRPGPRPLLAWNVFVGICFVAGQVSFMFFGCRNVNIRGVNLETRQWVLYMCFIIFYNIYQSFLTLNFHMFFAE